MTEAEVVMALKEMVRDGEVEKLPNGKYRITPKGLAQTVAEYPDEVVAGVLALSRAKRP